MVESESGGHPAFTKDAVEEFHWYNLVIIFNFLVGTLASLAVAYKLWQKVKACRVIWCDAATC